ncbi:MAG: glycerophosphodiester phosphodiesterase family protein [Clostridium sp.]|jgi:glycerophosphoryl diester phosphodiesterase|nr:glycerophosphodiester phosphodiesterase [Clostridiaceae bacterium]
MKILTKDTWQIIRQNWKNILLFELLYRGITTSVYMRLVSRGIRLALRAAGYSYLTPANIGNFLIRPVTLLIFAAVAFVGILILSLETAGLITAFQGSAYYQKLTPLHILWGGLQKLKDEMIKCNWRLPLFLTVQYLLIHLPFIMRTIVRYKPANFIFQELKKQPVAVAFLVVLLIFGILAVIPRSLTAYGCMIEQKHFHSGVVRSWQMTHKRKWKISSLAMFWELAVILLAVAVYAASVCAAALCVVRFSRQNLAMAVLLSSADRLETGIIYLASMLATVAVYAALSVAYYQYGNRRFHTERWDFGYPARGSMNRRTMAVILTAVVGVGLFYIYDLVRNGSELSEELLIETEITAHRGSSRTAPENTIPAIEAAVEEMADSVEIDVQMTADGVVVLGHDASLKRVAGVNRSIASMTFEELEKLDVGSWFSSEYAGTRIPSLSEVLELCSQKTSLNIEIKYVGKNSELPEKTAEMVREYGMENQCVITSTNLSYLKRVKEALPEIRTGYIISAAYGNFYSSEDVDFISIRSGFVTSALMQNAHEQGKAVYAWTVNTKSELERLTLLGVDGIITDRPVLAREIVYREEATESLFEYLKLVLR